MPDGERRTLFLVLGNSPGELVSDYGCHDLLDVVTDAHYTEWSERPQPKLTGAYMTVKGKYQFVPEAKAIQLRDALVRRINATIHSCNLYAEIAGERRRVVDCHVAEDGRVSVRDLYQEGRVYSVQYTKFFNGRGQAVDTNV
jgi:hypothetical protein